MRLIFSLFAGGLLLLFEIPAVQPPPPLPDYVQYYVVDTQTDQGSSGNFYSTTNSSIYQTGEWRHTAYSSANLGETGSLLLTNYINEDFQARQLPEFTGDALQNEPDLIAYQAPMASTPIPKATAPLAVKNPGQPSALPITGYATYYNPNVMQQVVNYRLAMGQVTLCNECVGTVALLRAGDLNRRVWLQWGDGQIEGPFLVVDAAASQHVAQLVARKWVVDVDNRTAVRHKMAGPVLVTVWSSPPSGNQSAEMPLMQLSYSIQETSEPANGPVRATVEMPVAQATPTRSATAQPPDASLTVGNVLSGGGFPTDTPVPTLTPLPAINGPSTPAQITVDPTASPINSATPTFTPTSTPTRMPSATATPSLVPATLVSQTTMKQGPATGTVTPTITPLPAINSTAINVAAPSPANTSLPTGGFPTASVEPTITPLPALITAILTPAAPAIEIPITTPISMPMATATIAPTGSPTLATSVTHVILGGFPTETPIATITPLPALSMSPTPTADSK